MKRLGLLLIVLPMFAQAQLDTVFVKQADLIRGVDAMWFTVTSPARWKGNDWLKVGGVAAGTLALTLLDKPVRDFARSHESPFLDNVERVGYHYGKPYCAVAFSGGIYLAGKILKNKWATETGLMLISGLTASTAIQTFFKNAVGRARPIKNLGNYELVPFSPEAGFHSLPSGHTSVALTISLIMARQIQYKPVKILFYTLGGITAASRLYSDAHWVSDVAFGGTIAWFCADAAFKRLQQNRVRTVIRKRGLASWKLYPYPGGLTLRASL